MAVYQVSMVNLYARENVEWEIEAESPEDAEKEALRRYPDNQFLSVTLVSPPGPSARAG